MERTSFLWLGAGAGTLLLGSTFAAVIARGPAANAAAPADTVASFASSMDAAMARMDRDMMVPASSDPDRDFAAMMIPHHQGAIDMAKAELRFGHDPVLRRLAQAIVVEQDQEIAVMRQALQARPPTPNAQMRMVH